MFLVAFCNRRENGFLEPVDSLNLCPTLYVKVQICQNNKLYDESRVNVAQC
jgi:hypothetical protein